MSISGHSKRKPPCSHVHTFTSLADFPPAPACAPPLSPPLCLFAQNFLEYNKEGFRKILKKTQKLTSFNLKDRYWAVIQEKYPSHKAKVQTTHAL
eukprot:359300-Chlamydomonas_euryale.AAC.2